MRANGAGTTLGDRYRLLDLVAVGGMGSVWEAEDLRLQRRVAVKLPAGDVARAVPNLVERFAREASAAARLSHPNVATVFDHGHDGDTPFIVMELLEGETLADRLRRGPLPVDEATAITDEVAAALDAAHAAGVIHRDVKPANVMLTSGGVKVMDFGVATAEWAQTITTTGVLGTAAYLSPEQAAGDPAVPASDVYALGAVAYEMLSGRPPFVADSAVAVVAAHLHRDPEPLAEVAPHVPDHVATSVERALAKDPAARPSPPTAFARLMRGHGDATSAALASPRHGATETSGVGGTRAASARASTGVQPTAPLLAGSGAATAPQHTEVLTPATTCTDEVDGRTRVLSPPVVSDRPNRWRWLAALAGLVLVALVAWAAAGDDPDPAPPPEDPTTTTETAAPPVVVPEVAGQPVRAAIEVLQGSGLVVADVVMAEGDRGIVLGVDPAAGVAVEPGTAVVLTVGDGSGRGGDDDDEDDGRGNGGGPGNGNGNGNGNGRGRGGD